MFHWQRIQNPGPGIGARICLHVKEEIWKTRLGTVHLNQGRLNSKTACLNERFSFRTFCFLQRSEGETRVFGDEWLKRFLCAHRGRDSLGTRKSNDGRPCDLGEHWLSWLVPVRRLLRPPAPVLSRNAFRWTGKKLSLTKSAARNNERNEGHGGVRFSIREISSIAHTYYSCVESKAWALGSRMGGVPNALSILIKFVTETIWNWTDFRVWMHGRPDKTLFHHVFDISLILYLLSG